MYNGGSGTEADPYLISSSTDLKNIESNMSAYFKQTCDITLGTFEPIGYKSTSPYYINFSGFYDGNGYSIMTGVISYISNYYMGIFAMNQGTIQNLILDGVAVTGLNYVGCIAGANGGGKLIQNCLVLDSCSINGSTYVGGVTGRNYGTIQKCKNSGYIGSSGSQLGGISGSMEISGSNNTHIYNCYNTASISGNDAIGGICGYMTVSTYTATIQYCYNTGNLSAKTNCGGIAGDKGSGTVYVYNCYALNDNIYRSSGTATTFGRICGDSGITLNNNYALDSMSFTSAV
jgi:hypothetical protein